MYTVTDLNNPTLLQDIPRLYLCSSIKADQKTILAVSYGYTHYTYNAAVHNLMLNGFKNQAPQFQPHQAIANIGTGCM